MNKEAVLAAMRRVIDAAESLCIVMNGAEFISADFSNERSTIQLERVRLAYLDLKEAIADANLVTWECTETYGQNR